MNPALVGALRASSNLYAATEIVPTGLAMNAVNAVTLSAIASLFLWLGVISCGRLLAYA